MLHSLSSLCFWNPSDHRGFCLGTCILGTLNLLMYSFGLQASVTVGPGGDFPRVSDVFLYAFSHDEPSALVLSLVLLGSVGRCQERRWGTLAFLSLSALTLTLLPFLYTLLLFVGSGEATRICGHSAVQLTLFTAQCRHLPQRRLLRCFPVWFLPWMLLLVGMLLLPGTPVLLHFCSICIGHNYSVSFIRMLQGLEEAIPLHLIPHWAYVPSSSRIRLPTYINSHSSSSLSQGGSADQAAPASMRDTSFSNLNTLGTASAWIMNDSADLSETRLLEEQLLRAGILASLRDAPDNADEKVEVSKSSVSSLRLQQLEKMGFSTEKAVVALAASKQLDGAISLLVDDSVGEHAVVVSKGKGSLSSQTP